MKLKTQKRQQAILEEATKLFCEQGYERASMSELAKRLGGSKTTLYNYFSSKDDLFQAVIENIGQKHLDPALQALLDSNELDTKHALIRFGESVIKLINEPTALAVYRMVLAEAGRTDSGSLFYKIGPQRVNDALSDFIVKAINNKVLKTCQPNVAARHFIFLMKAESENRLFERTAPPLTETQLKEMVARAADVFWSAYAVH